MAETVTNVSAGKPAVGGAVYRAPLGTTLPTDATTALGNAFTSLGFCSDDGLTNASNIENESQKAWGGAVVLKTQTGWEDTFSFKLIEGLNVDVLKAVYGDDNVTGSLAAGITVQVNDDEPEESVWVVDMITRNDTLKRIVIPDGKLTSLEDITYSDSEAFGYGCEMTALLDRDGNTHYEYIAKGDDECCSCG